MNPEEIRKLDAYFKAIFNNATLQVVASPRTSAEAEVYKGVQFLGSIDCTQDEDELSYNFSMDITDLTEGDSLENHFKSVFNNAGLQVKPRRHKDDSCEIYVGDEFLGVLYRDEENGKAFYKFCMAILSIDL